MYMYIVTPLATNKFVNNSLNGNI